MTPEQFLQKIRKQPLAPVYLFAGPERQQREVCRQALVERAVPPGSGGNGFRRHDLDEVSLNAVLDDARSLSLFAPERLIWAASAEGALPKRLIGGEEGAGSLLSEYLRHAPAGVTLVFDSARYGFEGEDKPKMDRLRKFYEAIPEVVEFRPFTPESARGLARDLAREAGLQIGSAEIGLLVETLGADGARIAQEIEKLRLFLGPGGKAALEDIRQLAPNAQTTTIFALVNALGRGDRKRSLESLDTLVRAGEYLPLALAFLAAQFRLALVAQEAGLRDAQQIQTHFTRLGIRVWRDRAEQVFQTAKAFPKQRLTAAMEKVYWADKALRDARPDDRVIMEALVLGITQ